MNFEEDFKQIVAVCEANSYEGFCLWKEWKDKVSWKQGMSGPIVDVGKVDNRTVWVSMLIHTINGKKILFIEPTSAIVDWNLIDDWLVSNLPKTAFKGEFVNTQNANNFHCLV